MQSSPTYMDCRDFSHFFNIMAASLGIQCQYRKIDVQFDTNYFKGAGSGSWENTTWNFHVFSWFSSSYVVDASLKIDNDAYPDQSPHTEKLPSGDISLNSYLDKLTEDDVSSDVDAASTSQVEN